jgi:hypothetical protein
MMMRPLLGLLHVRGLVSGQRITRAVVSMPIFLVMPTEMIAQNGLAIYQNTPIAVTGCAKPASRPAKLAAALKACHKKHGGKRASCERSARKRFGTVKKK